MTNRKNPPFDDVDPINDDATPSADLSTFQGCLTLIRDGEGSDGMLWPEEIQSDGRRQSLARIDRSRGHSHCGRDAACGKPLRRHGHAPQAPGRRHG